MQLPTKCTRKEASAASEVYKKRQEWLVSLTTFLFWVSFHSKTLPVRNARFVPHDKTKRIFLENASRVFQTT